MARLTADDATLWYADRGEGTPLVFVHGGWMNGDVWRPQVERYAGDYRVITYDVRGHGRTGGTDRRRYSVDRFVDDLERLLDYLGVERPVLCGLSLGSMIVQEYLARHAETVAGAVLAGAIRTMPPVDLPPVTKALATPTPALAASAFATGPRTTFRSLLGAIRATTGGPWLALDPDVRSEAMAAVGDVSRAEFVKVFGALYGFEPPDLSGVGTPALVVYGDREAPPVKRQGDRIASSVADGRVRTVPDAGHLVNRDSPAAFNAACTEFLTERADAGVRAPARMGRN